MVETVLWVFWLSYVFSAIVAFFVYRFFGQEVKDSMQPQKTAYVFALILLCLVILTQLPKVLISRDAESIFRFTVLVVLWPFLGLIIGYALGFIIKLFTKHNKPSLVVSSPNDRHSVNPVDRSIIKVDLDAIDHLRNSGIFDETDYKKFRDKIIDKYR